MTQSIIIQVGQCGNQIGYRFWDLAMREYSTHNKSGIYDEAVGSFFSNSNKGSRKDVGSRGREMIQSLKARAVLVDMEEGVVNGILNGRLKNLFSNKQLITDVSGCGNNWAVGSCIYGTQYRDQISNAIRQAAEACDCLQCFFCLHSMGGGTGAGVGTSILSILADEFPDVYRFTLAVYPSVDDDVITSPYNAVLAMKEITENANCALPIENQALIGILNKIEKGVGPSHPGKRVYPIQNQIAAKPGTAITSSSRSTDCHGNEKSFDAMNNIVANLILNMTSSSRFDGSLNMDLNEITTNLVPFPKLHYLIPSMTPLYSLSDVAMPPRKLDQMFTDAFQKDYQLVGLDPKHSLYLACGVILRGKVAMSDIRRNIDRLKSSLNFIHWNKEGWKTGLCAVPPAGHEYSLLTLANNTSFRYTCDTLRGRFMKLYNRKAHVHHYTQVDGFEQSCFNEAVESLDWLSSEYSALDDTRLCEPQNVPRLTIA